MHLVMSDKQQFHLHKRNDDLSGKYLISKVFSSSLKNAFHKRQTCFKSIEGYIIWCRVPVSLGDNHPRD